jgi:hypothetical protein
VVYREKTVNTRYQSLSQVVKNFPLYDKNSLDRDMMTEPEPIFTIFRKIGREKRGSRTVFIVLAGLVLARVKNPVTVHEHIRAITGKSR